MPDFWQQDETSVDPPSMDMVEGEDLVLSFNAAPLLAAGETVASATATLKRLDTGATVTLQDTPAVVGGNAVTQRARGLTGDVNYVLHIFATIGGRIEAMSLAIKCKK